MTHQLLRLLLLGFASLGLTAAAFCADQRRNPAHERVSPELRTTMEDAGVADEPTDVIVEYDEGFAAPALSLIHI